jgi:predicted TPR repeat methyltransferase
MQPNNPRQMPRDANEFIIRDGDFVRDFEGMYQHVEDPWDQQRNCDSDLLLRSSYWFLGEVLRAGQHELGHILDLGCGTGYCAEPLLSLGGTAAHCTGIDISETAISRAFQYVRDATPALTARVHFETGDYRILNPKLVQKFGLIYCGKALYYVGPEIDACVNHIGAYLSAGGLLCYTYNQRDDSFSNRYLTYDILRAKLLDYGFEEKLFVEMTNTAGDEILVVHICQKEAQ